MSRRIQIVAVVLVSIASVCAVVRAAGTGQANVETLINKALAAYKEHQTNQAIEYLQKAIGIMQKSMEKGLAACLPKAPPGWTAGKVKSDSVSIGSGDQATTYTQTSQTFTRTSDKLRVTVTFATSPQLIQAHMAMAAAWKNPQMLAMMNRDPDKKIQPIDKNGWNGWVVVEKGRTADVTVVRSGMLVGVKAGKGGEAVAKQFLNAIDLKALAKHAPKGAATKQPRAKTGKETGQSR